MQERFWRIVAIVECAALLYIGHGLHGTQPLGIPSLENRAEARGIAWDPEYPEMFTASEDGRIVYTWKRFKDVREGATVVGTWAAPQPHQKAGAWLPDSLVSRVVSRSLSRLPPPSNSWMCQLSGTGPGPSGIFKLTHYPRFAWRASTRPTVEADAREHRRGLWVDRDPVPPYVALA